MSYSQRGVLPAADDQWQPTFRPGCVLLYNRRDRQHHFWIHPQKQRETLDNLLKLEGHPLLDHLISSWLFLPYLVLTGHLCGGGVSQHGQDRLHFRSGRLHPQLQTGRVQEQQVCGVPDAAGCQCVLQLHDALPPPVLEHVHRSRYKRTHVPTVAYNSCQFIQISFIIK